MKDKDHSERQRCVGTAAASEKCAGSGDPAYRREAASVSDVGRVPPHGGDAGVAGSGDPAYRGPAVAPDRPRRLRRLDRLWPDRDGNISYLITLCADGRSRVLDNEIVFERFVSFLLDSPKRYDWFPHRFVVMPDHLHLIARQGRGPVRLGQWIKAMKAVVGGLQRREDMEANAGTGDAGSAGSGDPAYRGAASASDAVGRVPSHGGAAPSVEVGVAGSGDPAYRGPASASDAVGRVPSHGGAAPSTGHHPFTREKRSWRWQEGFHDHKFRTPESEQRKWEYICLNPVRYGLVERPEEWPFGGEILYEDANGPRIIRGTPPLLDVGILIDEEDEK